jgi:hypothetical protein
MPQCHFDGSVDFALCREDDGFGSNGTFNFEVVCTSVLRLALSNAELRREAGDA